VAIGLSLLLGVFYRRPLAEIAFETERPKIIFGILAAF